LFLFLLCCFLPLQATRFLFSLPFGSGCTSTHPSLTTFTHSLTHSLTHFRRLPPRSRLLPRLFSAEKQHWTASGPVSLRSALLGVLNSSISNQGIPTAIALPSRRVSEPCASREPARAGLNLTRAAAFSVFIRASLSRLLSPLSPYSPHTSLASPSPLTRLTFLGLLSAAPCDAPQSTAIALVK
jgi:hypothetical protein